MSDRKRILAIVGSYRKGHTIDTAVDEILAAAREAGAEVEKVHLIDKEIKFCTNCRSCTQEEGIGRGDCVIEDDMVRILDAIERADAFVLASPKNFGSVTAVMKRFIERLVCLAYWPWGTSVPKLRKKRKSKDAVIVASSAAPALLARISSDIIKQLKSICGLLGARTVGVLFIGMACVEKQQEIGEGARKKARKLGARLVTARSS